MAKRGRKVGKKHHTKVVPAHMLAKGGHKKSQKRGRRN
jgi:hypothetical protein